MPGVTQAWPNMAACWSPAMPVTGTGRPRMLVAPKLCGAVAYLGQHRTRNAEPAQEVVVPALTVDVEEHGAGGVAGVGCVHLAAGEAPEQEGVDRAEGKLAAFRTAAGIRHIVQEPGELGAGEIGVDHEARGGGHVLLETVRHQLAAQGRRAAVLPDDGVVHRSAGCAVPEHGRLALVGDADGSHRGRIELRCQKRIAANRQRIGPDMQGIVLDPAVGGIELLQLALCSADAAAVLVEDDGPRAGGSLIEGQDMARHAALPCSLSRPDARFSQAQQ